MPLPPAGRTIVKTVRQPQLIWNVAALLQEPEHITPAPTFFTLNTLITYRIDLKVLMLVYKSQ